MTSKKITPEQIAAYQQLDTSSITDAMDKLGIEGSLLSVQGVVPGTRLCGPAFTVHYIPCGLAKGTVGDFLDDVPEGYVIVIDNNGRTDCTVWGDIMSQVAKKKAVAGTVIDGVCRDVKIIHEIKYPVFSKGVYMRTGKDRVEVDYVNQPVAIAGLQVAPEDLIVADENGTVRVPYEMIDETLEIAQSIEKIERDIVKKVVSEGKTLKQARQETNYHHLQTKTSQN